MVPGTPNYPKTVSANCHLVVPYQCPFSTGLKSERLERRILVEELKKMRDAEPSSKFVIRKGEVVVADK